MKFKNKKTHKIFKKEFNSDNITAFVCFKSNFIDVTYNI
jgi:hypothetical protein